MGLTFAQFFWCTLALISPVEISGVHLLKNDIILSKGGVTFANWKFCLALTVRLKQRPMPLKS